MLTCECKLKDCGECANKIKLNKDRRIYKSFGIKTQIKVQSLTKMPNTSIIMMLLLLMMMLMMMLLMLMLMLM